MLSRFARRVGRTNEPDETSLRTDSDGADEVTHVPHHDDAVTVEDDAQGVDGSPDAENESHCDASEHDAGTAVDEQDELPGDDVPGVSAQRKAWTTPPKGVGFAVVGSALIVVALGGLIGFLAYRTHETRVAKEQRELFLQAGSQAAINLTTISYTHADADVARILDSATGAFHDDFQNRSQPFIDVVKKVQSISQGSITAAGLESVDGDQAQVIVAVSVKTSNAGVPEQKPRDWRMRLSVQKVGDAAKVSDVQFVP